MGIEKVFAHLMWMKAHAANCLIAVAVWMILSLAWVLVFLFTAGPSSHREKRSKEAAA